MHALWYKYCNVDREKATLGKQEIHDAVLDMAQKSCATATPVAARLLGVFNFPRKKNNTIFADFYLYDQISSRIRRTVRCYLWIIV